VTIRTNVVSSNPFQAEVYSIQHYVIKFVSDLWQVGRFHRITNKTDLHDTTEILLKVVLNTLTLTISQSTNTYFCIQNLPLIRRLIYHTKSHLMFIGNMSEMDNREKLVT